ncbi:MAG: AAA family ATPase, partial [Bacteroidia bacterium]|nr:AAA family ATPase [Bacteroidia bacterium]
RINLHAVFTGNPGTGKTTVALMLGKIYKQMGLLTRGHVHEVDRADIVGEYIGQTAPKVKEAIQKAIGGILFIDEAYSLTRKGDDTKDFGKEVIEILVKEMSDGDPNLAIIVAGYPEEMQIFLESNPGLKSRFTMIYHFPDYTPQELLQIADYTANKKSVTLEESARKFLFDKLVEAYRNRDRTFGNARLVNSLIEEAKMNMGLRLIKEPDMNALTKEQMSTILLEDVKKIYTAKQSKFVEIPIDEELLKHSLTELHNMIGLNSVKKEIDELVKLVRFYRETGKDVRKSFSLHTVFTGNPGTGKTTVARIVASIYKALGILERGHLLEVDRSKLVGSYIGQTSEKTTQLINAAMGGILFIDEAYSLVQGAGNDYGKEAIEILLKKMEDNRGDFIVIVAGYTVPMERFLESNPGLRSRFDRVLHFDDFSVDDLHQIALEFLKKEELVPDEEANTFLYQYLKSLYDNRDSHFGNGRTVRKIVEAAIKNQHLRMASL